MPGEPEKKEEPMPRLTAYGHAIRAINFKRGHTKRSSVRKKLRQAIEFLVNDAILAVEQHEKLKAEIRGASR